MDNRIDDDPFGLAALPPPNEPVNVGPSEPPGQQPRAHGPGRGRNTLIAAAAVAVLGLVIAGVALLGLGSVQSRLASLEANLEAVEQSATAVPDPGEQATAVSLFEAPSDLEALLRQVQASTVVIECKGSQGSGWVIDLGSPGEDASEEVIELDRRYPVEVITNDHVIEECYDTPRKVRATANGKTFDAYLYDWDSGNDLALVAITQQVPALPVSDEPQPGWWAAAIGTPYGLEGSVSIGNVMNLDGNDVIATTPLNPGNSGGPLVNSRGEVIGTNTWTLIGEDEPQDWNVAVGHPALCDEIVDCAGDTGWQALTGE